MNPNDYAYLHKQLSRDALELSLRKSHDYATEDVLNNFKRVSKAADNIGLDVRTPQGYALFMVLMKLDRINNLLREQKKPNNESLRDSFIDAINYLTLAYAILEEGNEILSIDAKEERRSASTNSKKV